MKWQKTTPYGDYRLTPDRAASKLDRTTHIIRKARALLVCGKHAGSKPTWRLLNGIKQAERAISKFKIAS